MSVMRISGLRGLSTRTSFGFASPRGSHPAFIREVDECDLELSPGLSRVQAGAMFPHSNHAGL